MQTIQMCLLWLCFYFKLITTSLTGDPTDQHPSGFNLGPQPGDQKPRGGQDPPKDLGPRSGDQHSHGIDGGPGPAKVQGTDSYHGGAKDHSPRRQTGEGPDGGDRSCKEQKGCKEREHRGSGSDSDGEGHGKHGHGFGHGRGRGRGHGHGRGGGH